MLQSNLLPAQLAEKLATVFKAAGFQLHSYSLGVECVDAARLFSLCALLSQLPSETSETAKMEPFHLNDATKSEAQQGTAMYNTVATAAVFVQDLSSKLKVGASADLHEARKQTLAITLGKSLFVSTLDSSYGYVFGSELDRLLRQGDVCVDATKTLPPTTSTASIKSSRLLEMWMDSSQCCKYGTLLRIRSQVLLMAKLFAKHIEQNGGVNNMDEAALKLYYHANELARNALPLDAEHDACNRGTFCNLRTCIVRHLITPCCEVATASIVADAVNTVLLGELTSVEHQYAKNMSLCEIAFVLLCDSGSLNAMTALASALTITAYGLVGNHNVHTHKEPKLLRWRNIAFEDPHLRRKANPFVEFLQPVDAEDPESTENNNNQIQVDKKEAPSIGRWTSIRKRESHEMETYSEIFHICNSLREDLQVMQLRSLARAYFCYATSKASQASNDSQARSWLGAASSTYRNLLTSPNLDQASLCPPFRKPDTRRAQLLQCATLLLIDQSVNDMTSETVAMSRLETQVEALELFNQALFRPVPLKDQVCCTDRSDKRWAAKLVGSFTPMLAFLLSTPLQQALAKTFLELRKELEQGRITLEPTYSEIGQMENSTDSIHSVNSADSVFKNQAFSTVGALMDRLTKHALAHVKHVEGVLDESTEWTLAEKRAIGFSLKVQEQLWRVSSRDDGWVNVLHFRSCRASDKRPREE